MTNLIAPRTRLAKFNWAFVTLGWVTLGWVTLGWVTLGWADPGDAAIVDANLVRPNTIAVTVRDGHVTLGKLVPYQPQPGDTIKVVSSGLTQLIRDGQAIGALTGDDDTPERFVRLNDEYQGVRASRDHLTVPAAWSITAGDQELAVVSAYRKSRIRDAAEVQNQRPQFAWDHHVYLVMQSDVPLGPIDVRSSDPVFARDAVSASDPITFNLATATSEAIHVTAVGFRPDDPAKHAVLSMWMGDGGPVDYRDGGLPPFVVREVESGEIVHRGTAVLLAEADQPADHRGLQGRPDGTAANQAGTPTFKLDFSDLTRPGRYRVIVKGIGQSPEFPIAEDAYRPWFDLAMQGLAAHRWGESRSVPLSDGTTMDRPAATPARHNDGGVPIYETSAAYTNANFGDFEPGKIGPWKPVDASATVIGGYMDAGDFDRNHNHYIVSYLLLDLAQRIDRKGVSGGRPDPARVDALIEAALWNVDLWKRIQHDDGGVPSAVEYAEHPRTGEPSWINSLPMYVCGPSIESSIHHAIASAKAASVLARRNDARSTGYADSARAALDWARQTRDDQWAASDPGQDVRDSVNDEFASALAEVWRATGDEALRAELMAIWDARIDNAWKTLYPSCLSGVLTVLEMPSSKSNLTADQRERLTGSAKHTISMTYLDGSFRKAPFATLKNGWIGTNYGNGGWPSVDTANVLRAWQLFDDPECLRAAVSGFAFAAGGNPTNQIWMTGTHPRSVRHPLHCDSHFVGVAAPVGIPIYGPTEPVRDGTAWPLNWHLQADPIVPVYEQWPAYENIHGYWLWAVMNEYTVHQTSASVIYFAGMLDAR